MKKRMGILILAGVLTFNQAGMITFANDVPTEETTAESVQVLKEEKETETRAARKAILTPNSGEWEIGSGENAIFKFKVETDDAYASIKNYEVKANGIALKEGTDYEFSSTTPGSYEPVEVTLMMKKAYTGTKDREIKVYMATGDDGNDFDAVATITQKASSSGVEQGISEVKEISREVLEDKSTKIVYSVKGTGVEISKITAKEIGGMYNLDNNSFIYNIEEGASADEKKVTVTFKTVIGIVIEGNYKLTFTLSDGSKYVQENVKVDPNAPVTPPEEVAPTLESVTPATTTLESKGGEVEFTLKGANLKEDATTVKVKNKWGNAVAITSWNLSVEGKGETQKVKLTFPENPEEAWAEEYTVEFYPTKDAEAKTAKVTVKAKEAQKPTPVLTAVQPLSSEVTNENRNVSFDLVGSNLDKKVTKVQVTLDGVDVTNLFTDIKVTGFNAFSQTVTMTLPENVTDADKVYKVHFYVDGNTDNKADTNMGVAEVKVLADKKEEAPTIASVTPTAENLQSKGGEVVFTLNGKNLTENTKISAKLKGEFGEAKYDEGKLNMKVEGKGDSEKVTLTFPENTSVYDPFVYTITFHANGDNTDTTTEGNTATAKVTVDKKVVATLYSVTTTTSEITNDNRAASFDLSGMNLSSTTKAKVMLGDKDVTAEIDDIAITGSGWAQKATMTMPENTSTEKDAVYTVYFYADGNVNNAASSNRQSATVTVKKAEKPVVTVPALTAVSPETKKVNNDNRTVEFTLTGSNLTKDTGIYVATANHNVIDVASLNPVVEGTGSSQKVTLTFPKNASAEFDQAYVVKFYANGKTTDNTTENNMVQAEVTVEKIAVDKVPAFASITPDKVETESDKTTVEFKLAGQNLDGTAFKITQMQLIGGQLRPINVTDDLKNDVTITGKGNEQTVTVKFPENTSIKDDAEYTVYFYANGNSKDSSTLNNRVQASVTVLKKGEKPAPEKADKTELDKAIKDAEVLKAEDYTADSWKAMQEALEAAKKVSAKEDAKQDEVDAAAETLNQAVKDLKEAEKPAPEKVDKTALDKAIKDAEALKAEDYTTDSWKAMQEALETAKKVSAKEDAKQDEVDAAEKALNQAVKDLKEAEKPAPEKADKTELDKAIKDAEALKAEDYTTDSWKAMQEALEAAKEVSAKEDAKQDEVDAAAEALNTAVKGLVEAEAKDPTTPPVKDPTTPPTGSDKPVKPTTPTQPAKPEETKKPTKGAPKTGDPSNIGWLFAQGTLALGVIGSVFKRKKDEEK